MVDCYTVTCVKLQFIQRHKSYAISTKNFQKLISNKDI